MRFLSVTAHAFGPFQGRTLEFSNEFNLVFGLNETGKSTWHAALYAGLCGMRRGKGKQRLDQEFTDRHRPWEGDEWRVGVVIRLEDGRRIECEHDLLGKVDAGAIDLDLGRDCSGEIIQDGTPDGAFWLGLDRRSFIATACVRQADMLGVFKSSGELQEFLQRAADAFGAETTAAHALELLERFYREHIGAEVKNSRKPLRLAIDQVEHARENLARARDEHASYLDLLTAEGRCRREANTASRNLKILRVLQAREASRHLAGSLERARKIRERHPDGPPRDLATSEALALSVRAALEAWNELPPEPALDGRPATEIRDEIARLPSFPTGELEPDPRIEALHERLVMARQFLEDHDRLRPEIPGEAISTTASREEIDHLAGRLAVARPVIDGGLEEIHARQREELEALRSRPWRPFLLAAGGLLAILGTLLLVLEFTASGALVLALAALIIFWLLMQNEGAAVARALHELRDLEERLGEQRYQLEEWERRRGAAIERARELELPTVPDELERLADALDRRREARRDLAKWQEHHDERTAEEKELEARLRSVLEKRGFPCHGDAADDCRDRAHDIDRVHRDYRDACVERTRQAMAARRRPELERELALVEAAEKEAWRVRQRRETLSGELGRLTNECALETVEGGDVNAAVSALGVWLDERASLLARQEESVREWAERETILDGRSEGKLELELKTFEAQARELAVGIDEEELASVVNAAPEDGIVWPDEALTAARERAGRADAELARVRGQIREREKTLGTVSEAEEALREAEAELARVRKLQRTLSVTREFLSRAQEEIHRTIAPLLAESIKKRLAVVTAARYHDVRVDPRSLDLRVCGEGGRWRTVAMLSHGAAEQIYLLLRVALAEHLTRRGEICPLILDDITVHCDAGRKRAMLEILKTLSRDHQIILFSQEHEVLEWARENLHSPLDRIIELDPGSVGV